MHSGKLNGTPTHNTSRKANTFIRLFFSYRLSPHKLLNQGATRHYIFFKPCKLLSLLNCL